MIKVLIVDDEPVIRQGLRILIDWRDLGFEIADEAANGKEAINLLETNHYDLVISDIKMPCLNGLELINYVKINRLSNAKFILLSGYYDFEYAKQAIRYNVQDYILKPIQSKELIRVLLEYKLEHKKREKELLCQQQMERMVFDKHLLSLIWDKYEESTISYVKQYLATTKELRYISIDFITTDDEFQTLSEKKKRNVQKELYHMLLQSMGKNKHHVLLDVKHHESNYDVGFIYAKLFAKQQGLSEHDYITKLIDPIKREIKYRFNVYIGQMVHDIDQISTSFQSAMIAKSFQTFRNVEDISYYEEAMYGKYYKYGVNKEKIDSLIRAVEEDNKDLMESRINEVYQELNNQQVNPKVIKLNIDYLLCCFLHLANELNPDENQEEMLRNICEGAFEQFFVRGSSIHFKKFVMEFADYLNHLRQSTYRGILNYIEREIEEHYMDDLSLKMLSEKYYMNSAYLGQIFKKKYGVSFKNYLNNYRIQRATELLLRTDEKIYMIAETVGYHNLDYFINKFVQIKGKTPLQYRKQYV